MPLNYTRSWSFLFNPLSACSATLDSIHFPRAETPNYMSNEKQLFSLFSLCFYARIHCICVAGVHLEKTRINRVLVDVHLYSILVSNAFSLVFPAVTIVSTSKKNKVEPILVCNSDSLLYRTQTFNFESWDQNSLLMLSLWRGNVLLSILFFT